MYVIVHLSFFQWFIFTRFYRSTSPQWMGVWEMKQTGPSPQIVWETVVSYTWSTVKLAGESTFWKHTGRLWGALSPSPWKKAKINVHYNRDLSWREEAHSQTYFSSLIFSCFFPRWPALFKVPSKNLLCISFGYGQFNRPNITWAFTYLAH